MLRFMSIVFFIVRVKHIMQSNTMIESNIPQKPNESFTVYLHFNIVFMNSKLCMDNQVNLL